MKNKIEINILVFIIIEAVYLLFFISYDFINIFLGTLFGIILILLSKFFRNKRITNYLLKIISIPIIIISLLKIVYFINNIYLKNYSPIIIGILFIMISVYLINKKYHTFIKTVEIISYFIIVFKTISLLLTIPLIKLNSISNSITLNYSNSFLIFGLFIFLLYKIIECYLDYKIKIKTILISLINPMLIKILSLNILGSFLFNKYNYPYVNYFKEINYFDFIERMEGLLSLEYMFCYIIMFSFFLLFVTKKANKLA